MKAKLNEIKELDDKIINLLKERGTKITVTDIATMLRKSDEKEYIQSRCENLYERELIDFAGNNRYYIMDEGLKIDEPKSKSAEKTSMEDVESTLKKLKDLLDKGLIKDVDYEKKKNELLGL